MTATPEVDELDQRIGETVHMLLFRRRMRQRPLAAAMGVTPSVLSKKLRGESAWSARQVLATAQLFGVSVADLYGEAAAQQSTPPTDGGGGWAPSGSNRRPTDYKSLGSVTHIDFRTASRARAS